MQARSKKGAEAGERARVASAPGKRRVRVSVTPAQYSIKISAFEDEEKIGQVNLNLHEQSKCKDDLQALRKMLGIPRLKLYTVGISQIEEEFRNSGLGVEMYLYAAEVAAAHGGAISADEDCSPYGATSESARRVWNSKRFNLNVIRVGKVVYRREKK